MQNGNPKKKVSVIVPVYNAERYLEKCLSSLVEQTYENVEIILVDDGSTDNSGRICDMYAEKFPKVRCYHRDNQGAGAARNFGMERSTGDYIMFVDADDYIAKRCAAETVGVAERYQADLVDFGKVYMLSAKNLFENTDGSVRRFRSVQEVRQTGGNIRKMIWGKLYRRDLALSVRFTDRQRGEDACYMAEILERCGILVRYNHCLYAYRAYQESLTRGNASVRTVKKELGLRRAAYGQADGREQKEEALKQTLLYCQKTAGDIVYRGEEAVSQKQLQLLKEQIDQIGRSQNAVTGEGSIYELLKTVDALVAKAIETSQIIWFLRVYKSIKNLFSRCMGRIRTWMNYEYKID